MITKKSLLRRITASHDLIRGVIDRNEVLAKHRLDAVCEEMKIMSNTIDKQKSEISELKWRISNPPKYSVGDKIGTKIVTNVSISSGWFLSCMENLHDDICQKFPQIKRQTSYSWKYTVTDVKTGVVSELTE